VGLQRYTVDASTPLAGDFDLKAELTRISPSLHTKGMFFLKLVEKIGPRWSEVAQTLDAAPRFGKYVAFVDYPSRDHMRLIDAAARAALPGVPTREGHRRMGKVAMEDFAASNVGRVVMTLVSREVKDVLLEFPRAYGMTVKSLRPVRGEALEDCVRISFDEPVIGAEYVIGVLESIVRYFERTPRIAVEIGDNHGTFDVRWLWQ
jgi:uncharacterized protein (TIGR02265 family)